jgi:hypothetical protein
LRLKLRLFIVPLLLGGAVIGGALASVGANAAGTTTSTTTSSATALPTAKTTAASSVTTDGATLNGTVVANASTASCYFEYGPTTAYGSRTPTQTIAPQTTTTAQALSTQLTGLEARQLFHYQLVCVNTLGGSNGGDLTFTSADHGPSAIRLSGHTAFVSGSGDVGVFVGCYGDRTCTGSLTLSRDGHTVGHRSVFIVTAEQGGIVHITLNGTGRAAIRHYGVITVSVSGSTTQGQTLQGGDAGLRLLTHPFS